MTPTHTFALVYALRRAAGRCIHCPRPANGRLCPECEVKHKARIKDEKRSLKYGREQAREAR
jgi:hypothetical protein